MIDRKICIAAVAAGIVLIAILGCVIFTITSAHSGTMTLDESLDKAMDNQGQIRLDSGETVTLNRWTGSGMYWTRSVVETDANSVIIKTYSFSGSVSPSDNEEGSLKQVRYYSPAAINYVTWVNKGITYTWYN